MFSKKQFSITLFLLIPTAFAFAQIANDDSNFFNYTYYKELIKRNKVETATVEWNYKDGKGSGKSIYQFSKQGFLTKQIIIDQNDKVKSEYHFLTNSQGDLIRRIYKSYEYNTADTVHFFKAYKAGQLIKDSSSQIPIGYNYEYNSKGKLCKTVVNSNFSLGNKRSRVTIIKLDSLDRISNSIETVFENEQDSTGSIFSDREFFYNRDGKIEKEIEKLNSKNSWMANKGSINYMYDSSGNLTQLIKTNAASYFYTYDDKGLITTKKMLMELESDDIIDTATKIDSYDKYTYTFAK